MDNFIDKIHLGKWEDVLPKIPARSVDMIITSPPYNVKLGDNKHKKDSYDSYDDNLPYNEYLGWMMKLFAASNRILKTGGRMAINIGDGANGSVPTHADFTYMLLNMNMVWSRYVSDPMCKWVDADSYEPFKMMTTIIWDKNQIGASTAWGSWKSPSQPSFPTQFEFIIVVAKNTIKHEGDKSKISVSKENFIRNSRALWTFPPETAMMKEFDHPAMFPQELPRRLIDQLTYQDDIVLDPFSGAGTTCVTAKEMGRHFIGSEMSPKYHQTSVNRLSGIPTMKTNTDGDKIPAWME